LPSQWTVAFVPRIAMLAAVKPVVSRPVSTVMPQTAAGSRFSRSKIASHMDCP
jgi:hypothetical protein